MNASQITKVSISNYLFFLSLYSCHKNEILGSGDENKLLSKKIAAISNPKNKYTTQKVKTTQKKSNSLQNFSAYATILTEFS